MSAKFLLVRCACWVHRDTIYALLNGDNVSEKTRYALTRLILEIAEETAGHIKTRLMSISLNQGMPRLHIGIRQGINWHPGARQAVA